jgi:hypothetical protein
MLHAVCCPSPVPRRISSRCTLHDARSLANVVSCPLPVPSCMFSVACRLLPVAEWHSAVTHVPGQSRDRCRMSSIILRGDTFHGISVFGCGVYKHEHGRATYAGQHRDGHACGLGVLTWSSGLKVYAEHGPDGKCDGRYLGRTANGDTDYRLFERGKAKDHAVVFADGSCTYNGEVCAPDDPRLLALIAQVAPVEVRPAAPAPHPPIARHPPLATKRSSDGSAGSFCRRRRWRPPWPPRCTSIPHAVAGGCAAQPNSSRTAKHDLAVMRARTVLR